MNATLKTAPRGTGTNLDAVKAVTAKVSHAKAKATPARELPSISSVKLVPLDLIDIRPQVRTVFDRESIAELADDIQARGLLQPVLLNPHGTRFTLIAGERRVRACRLAELSDIPALITKASEGDALLMQLAENVQREDLELQDEVNAIRLLHDNLKTVQAVADTVKKSSAWVSKRLALSHPDFGHKARMLMERGVTEDVEILNTLSHIESLNYIKANELEKQLLGGTATRETARQMLKDIKNPKVASTDPKLTESEERGKLIWQKRQEEREAEIKKQTEGEGPEFIQWAMNKLADYCQYAQAGGFRSTEFFDKLQDNQRAILRRHVTTLQEEARSRDFKQWAYFANCEYSDYNYLDLMIGIYTLKGYDIAANFAAFLTMVEDANRPEVEK